MTATETMVCYHCGAPAEIDPAKCKPGEIHYKPCSACGRIGIRCEGDLYRQVHKKKANVPSYDKSPYRGGRL
jgi:hypothetical protein